MRLYSDVVLEELPGFFLVMLEDILEKEGEWSNDENDHPTKWGIIQATADDVGYTGRLEDLSRHEAKQCWAIHSWFTPRYDLIAAHSVLICREVVDTSGPAGRSTSTKHFQRLLNALNDPVDTGYRYGPDLKVDGLLGVKSMVRLSDFLSHRGRDGERLFAVAINCMQLSHFVLTSENKTGKRDFSYGWWDKRVFNDLSAIMNDATVHVDNTLHVT